MHMVHKRWGLCLNLSDNSTLQNEGEAVKLIWVLLLALAIPVFAEPIPPWQLKKDIPGYVWKIKFEGCDGRVEIVLPTRVTIEGKNVRITPPAKPAWAYRWCIWHWNEWPQNPMLPIPKELQ